MKYFITGVLIYSYFTNILSFDRFGSKDSNYDAIKSHRNTERSKRVVNGENVEKHSKPWTVYLLRENKYNCGGFLLDPHFYMSSSASLPPKGTSDIVVTAAHCVTDENHKIATSLDPSMVRAYFGVHDPNKKEKWVKNSTAKDIIIHDKYTHGLNGHDIGIIRLHDAVSFSQYVQPLNITSFDSTSVLNCSLSGWGRGVHGAGVLATAYFEDRGNVSEILASVTVREKGDAKTIQGDSGSPILCHKDGQPLAQGVLSLVDLIHPFMTYTDIFQTRSWLLSAIEEIYASTVFHVELYKYIRFGARNREIMLNKLGDSLQNFYGYMPKGVQVKLQNKVVNYRQVWVDSKLEKLILLDHNVFNPTDIVGYSEEKDVYNCVSACFMRNSLGGCNYVSVLKRCYFLSSRQPCGDSRKCLRFGDFETVHIYYNETLIGENRTLIQPARTIEFVRSRSDRKTSNHVRYSVYLSYEREEGYICPATLKNLYQNDSIYDIATVSEKCLHNLIHPYANSTFDLNDTLHINILSNSTEPERIIVSIDRMKFWIYTNPNNSKTYADVLNLSKKIPFRNYTDKTINGPENDRVDVPVAVRFNQYMGGHEVGPFTKPWMVLLQGPSGYICQGVFVHDPQLEQSTPKKYYVLTSAVCFMKSMPKARVRFGVHLSTMESLYERSVNISQAHVNRQNNLALIAIQNSFSLNKQIRPISLLEEFEQKDSNLMAYGWNLKCPHAKTLHKIPMSFVNSTSSTTLNVTPKEKYAAGCNDKSINTGRPLMICTIGNSECALIGISTYVSVVDGESRENVTIIRNLLPWLRESMKSNKTLSLS